MFHNLHLPNYLLKLIKLLSWESESVQTKINIDDDYFSGTTNSCYYPIVRKRCGVSGPTFLRQQIPEIGRSKLLINGFTFVR